MKTKKKGMSYAKWGYIFLAPFFITFFIFQFWPLATTIYYYLSLSISAAA